MQQAIWLHASALTATLPQAIGAAGAGANCPNTSEKLHKMTVNSFTISLLH
jgi:hypothetical protein